MKLVKTRLQVKVDHKGQNPCRSSRKIQLIEGLIERRTISNNLARWLIIEIDLWLVTLFGSLDFKIGFSALVFQILGKMPVINDLLKIRNKR